MLFLAYLTGELQQGWDFQGWSDPWFCLQFALSSIFGFVLVHTIRLQVMSEHLFSSHIFSCKMFSVVLCTQYNSALTTAVTGELKNMIITYLGKCYRLTCALCYFEHTLGPCQASYLEVTTCSPG